MPPLHTVSRRLQMLALLAILIAFDAVAVAVAYVLAYVAAGVAPLLINQWDHLFWSMSFDIVPLWPVEPFDLVWASPPCQAYSRLSHIHYEHPKDVHPTIPELAVRDVCSLLIYASHDR